MIRTLLLLLSIFIASFVKAQEIRVEKVENVVSIDGKFYYQHPVQQGQTLFSICKAYGVTVSDVLAINQKNDANISIGDILTIPYVPPFKRLDDDFYYHKMRPKETLYSISQKFGIKLKRILKDNPEYDVSRPIAEGAVVRLSLKQINRRVLDSELRYLDRKEREEEALYNREFQKDSINIVSDNQDDDEFDLNRREFFIGEDNVRSRRDYDFERKHLKVAVLLPFYLDSHLLPEEDIIYEEVIDSLGMAEVTEMPRYTVNSKADQFLQFYHGVLLALEDLKKYGYVIDLYVYDTDRDTYKTRQIVSELNEVLPDLIIGPVYSSTYKVVMENLVDKTIPVIYPLSTRGDEFAFYPNFIQMTPSNSLIIDEMAKWVAINSQNSTIVNINYQGMMDKETQLSTKIRSLLSEEKLDDFVDFYWSAPIEMDELKGLLSKNNENIVILPTTDESALIHILPILSKLSDDYNITLVGFQEWLKYKSVEENMYYKVNLKLFVNTYVDKENYTTKIFNDRYWRSFDSEPSSIVNKAYDVTMAFIPFVDNYRIGSMNYLNRRQMDTDFGHFIFTPIENGRGYVNKGLLVIDYNPDYTISVSPFNTLN